MDPRLTCQTFEFNRKRRVKFRWIEGRRDIYTSAVRMGMRTHGKRKDMELRSRLVFGKKWVFVFFRLVLSSRGGFRISENV